MTEAADHTAWSPGGKLRSVSAIATAQVAALSVWFSSAAVLPDLASRYALSSIQEAAYTSAVQLGFVLGALLSAILNLADRFDPRRFFAVSSLAAGAANAALLLIDPAAEAAILLRSLAGVALAGVYPVGLKLAAGWGLRDRGLLVGLLVGALTLGSALPHLIAGLSPLGWRIVILAASLASVLAALLIALASLGPYHGTAERFRPERALLIWTDRRLRLVNLGYLGHMWELYAMWAWIGTALAAGGSLASLTGEGGGSLIAFGVIAVGAGGCIAAGLWADRIGKAEVTILAMAASGSCAVLAGVLYDGPAWLLLPVLLVWGVTIVADSAQFSALIADFAPKDSTGTMLTMQTCQGFLLTAVTVQVMPSAASWMGWPWALALLALGPLGGILAMQRLRRLSGARNVEIDR